MLVEHGALGENAHDCEHAGAGVGIVVTRTSEAFRLQRPRFAAMTFASWCLLLSCGHLLFGRFVSRSRLLNLLREIREELCPFSRAERPQALRYLHLIGVERNSSLLCKYTG